MLFLVGCSCSPEEKPNWDNQKILELARIGDPNLRIVIPTGITETLIDCNDYNPPCRYGVKVVIKELEMNALYYESQKSALEAARRTDSYITRNWVLDDVRGEPILERFAKKYLEAQRAIEIKDKSK